MSEPAGATRCRGRIYLGVGVVGLDSGVVVEEPVLLLVPDVFVPDVVEPVVEDPVVDLEVVPEDDDDPEVDPALEPFFEPEPELDPEPDFVEDLDAVLDALELSLPPPPPPEVEDFDLLGSGTVTSAAGCTLTLMVA